MERNLVRSTVVPSSSLEGKEYYAVKVDGALTSAAGDAVYGIVERGRPAGEPSVVVVGGEYWAYVGEDVSAGDWLTGGADGKLVKATAGTNYACAIALESASANNLCRVMIR